jgi:hypothetical protein
LKHVEWDGDGWGGAATGDWTSYVVFNPSNSLAATMNSDESRKVEGRRDQKTVPPYPATAVSIAQRKLGLRSRALLRGSTWTFPILERKSFIPM